MTSVRMHVHMQIFTHEGENVQLQLKKTTHFSDQAASRWMEQFNITSNFEVLKVVVCHDNKSLPQGHLTTQRHY